MAAVQRETDEKWVKRVIWCLWSVWEFFSFSQSKNSRIDSKCGGERERNERKRIVFDMQHKLVYIKWKFLMALNSLAALWNSNIFFIHSLFIFHVFRLLLLWFFLLLPRITNTVLAQKPAERVASLWVRWLWPRAPTLLRSMICWVLFRLFSFQPRYTQQHLTFCA